MTGNDGEASAIDRYRPGLVATGPRSSWAQAWPAFRNYS